MNQRIKELAEQAGVNLSSFQFSGTPIKYEVSESDLEKFAELIVKECAEWLKQPVNQTPLSGAVMNIAADRLKEHFGVEE